MNDKIFYHAPGARTGDVIPKYIDGEYQLFYLKNWKDPKLPGTVHGWHRMQSSDLLHMSEETPIHVIGGTGDLICWQGQWHLFACIFPEGKQFVTHYISKDGSLDHWEYIEEDTFGPDGLCAKDYRTWDWGGSMVIHQLGQQPDGDLKLALPKAKREAFTDLVENSFLPVTDGWHPEENRYSAQTSNRQQMMLMQPLPESFYIKTEIQIEDAFQAGVILQADQTMKEGYYIYLEPERKRLVYRSWLRMSEEGGKTFPYDVELEAPVRIAGDGRYELEIIAEGSAATAYVNGETALSFRMYDYSRRNLGLFSFGKAEFKNIIMKKRSE